MVSQLGEGKLDLCVRYWNRDGKGAVPLFHNVLVS